MRRPKKIRFDAFSLVSCMASNPDVELDEEDKEAIEGVLNAIPIPFTKIPFVGSKIKGWIESFTAKFLYCLDVSITEVGANGRHDNRGEAGKA